MESSRFPGKVSKQVRGKNSVEWIICRLDASKYLDEIYLALADTDLNRQFVEKLNIGEKVKLFWGDMFDVFSRFESIANIEKADLVVRLTGDCPLINYEIVDEVVELIENRDCDLASNTYPPVYPDGLDCSVFTSEALFRASEQIVESFDREHVTSYIYRDSSFKKCNVPIMPTHTQQHLSIDNEEDLLRLEEFLQFIDFEIDTSVEKILRSLDSWHPQGSYHDRIRNIGSEMNYGVKRFEYAKSRILGGNSLFSKRPFLISPLKWPSYFSKAKGVRVWDLAGNEFLDMSSLGVGACIHGYANEYVDNFVISKIRDGVATSLNCEEEILLAEKIIEIHPWSGLVKFTRSGAEANDIALRIARAHTGKSRVAFSGYHGWHDWYLSANIESANALRDLHLPGLNPVGVPKELSGISSPFSFGDLEKLRDYLQTGEYAAVIMEVYRNVEPSVEYLREVRELCDKHGAVLIFDECTSGFRENLGGLHLKYGVNPDLATLSKALGNGYAISSVFGRKEFMASGEHSFISSTNWSERVGPSAALATIELFEKNESWRQVSDYGKQVKEFWVKEAKMNELDIDVFGLPAMAKFKFNYEESNLLKTVFTENMLSFGILATTQVNISTVHNQSHFNAYFAAASESFKLVKNLLTEIVEVPPHLKHSAAICKSDFARLN